MYTVEYAESVIKQLRKLYPQTQRIIRNWIGKNLVGTVDPRIHGKPLKGDLAGVWRYRIGDYRLFASIEDDRLVIFLFEIGHRREVYR